MPEFCHHRYLPSTDDGWISSLMLSSSKRLPSLLFEGRFAGLCLPTMIVKQLGGSCCDIMVLQGLFWAFLETIPVMKDRRAEIWYRMGAIMTLRRVAMSRSESPTYSCHKEAMEDSLSQDEEVSILKDWDCQEWGYKLDCKWKYFWWSNWKFISIDIWNFSKVLPSFSLNISSTVSFLALGNSLRLVDLRSTKGLINQARLFKNCHQLLVFDYSLLTASFDADLRLNGSSTSQALDLDHQQLMGFKSPLYLYMFGELRSIPTELARAQGRSIWWSPLTVDIQTVYFLHVP